MGFNNMSETLGEFFESCMKQYGHRIGKNVTQDDFADAIEVDRITVNSWINNKHPPSREHIEKMCGLAGTTLAVCLNLPSATEEDDIEQAMALIRRMMKRPRLRSGILTLLSELAPAAESGGKARRGKKK